MARRSVWMVGWMAGLWGLGAASPAWCADRPLSSYFPDEDDDALIRRLEPAPAGAQTAGGLVLRQAPRWDGKLGMLFVESTLTNSAEAARPVGRVNLIDWRFRLADGTDDLRYRKLAYRRDVWYGSTYWTGPNWTRVGRNWHHPGIDTPSVRRFRVRRDGRVTITGRVRKADTNKGGGDGVRVAIRHNARTVWKAEIDGNDSTGLEPKLTLQVRKGDAIRFVVHKRGRIFYDTTWWDPIVTFADGERSQASKSFSTGKQGLGGWFYEMEVDPRAAVGLARIRGLDRNLVPRESIPDVGKPVRLSSRSDLPILIVDDGADRSGVLLAWMRAGSWQIESALTREGSLRIQLAVGAGKAKASLEPGESLRLPPIALGAYRERRARAQTMLGRLIAADPPDAGVDDLRRQIAAALRRAAGSPDADLKPPPDYEPPELDLALLVQTEWRREDKLTETAASYAAAAARHVEKATRLLADLQADRREDFLAAEAAELERLASLSRRGNLKLEERRALYFRLRWLKRRIALANPLMKFDRLLFCKRVPTSYSHLVMQYFGWRARPGGGLFVLDRPGYSLAARDILDGKLADGNVLEPRLSYDGKRIVFSFVPCGDKAYEPSRLRNDRDEGFYHIYEATVDGSGLRQLTRGAYDDVMPAYLPDGGIVFCSTRRRGYARCFGGQFSPRWHVYTLHRMDADGRNIRALSFHDTNEWFPAVGNDGLILYSRWDYIDRDAVTHQNLWATRPDGTNPVALWGNATASPHCSFQIQPIPGSRKVVFTASAHHSITGGSIAVVDPTLGNNGHEPITRITPEIPFPEAEGRNIREYYAAPWPLSGPARPRGAGRYFLVAYSPQPLVWEPRANSRSALGIYLLDAFGSRELIYRDIEIGSTNPCPLRPRPRPPVLRGLPARASRPAEAGRSAPPTGEMVLMDIYQGLGKVRRGRIKSLRIIQILPKTTPVANQPPIGLAAEENARAILGQVPVEPDGSAHFLVPARKPILFQALDEDGLAYQTMRSVTYVQPGERVSCIGCHENRLTAPPQGGALALRRPPSRIDPGVLGGRPFSYVCAVQPVLDKHCIRCHSGPKPKGPKGPKGTVKGIDLSGTPHKGYTRSYWSLCGDRSFWAGGTNPKNAAEALVPRFGGRNPIEVTPPGGTYGALGSRLIRMLRKGHNDVKLSADDLRRLAAWIDCNAVFYGAYDPRDQARELRGKPVAMPGIQ